MSAPSAAGNRAEADSGRGVIHIEGVFPHLQVKDHGGYQSRHASTLAVLREAFQKTPADFAGLRYDFFIGSFDNPESCNVLAEVVPTVLAYSVTPQCRSNIIAIPDFVYGGWPEAGIASYSETAAAIAAAGKAPPVIDKAFWIGNAGMDPSRQELVEIGAQHPDDMDFIGMKWLPDQAAENGRIATSRFVSLPDHARYSMLLDIRGAGYSGRLKLLMQAGRPVLLVERRFREFFYDRLKPFEHYLPVKEDLSDLVEKVAELKKNPERAARLGQGAADFARAYLTRDYALHYWREVLLRIGAKA